jgi:hypothetical protein
MCIESKSAREKAKGAFSIRAHFLGVDGNAAACAEDFHREDEPEPAVKRRRDSFWDDDDGDGARETPEPLHPEQEKPHSLPAERFRGETRPRREGRTSPNEGEEDRRAETPKKRLPEKEKEDEANDAKDAKDAFPLFPGEPFAFIPPSDDT